MRAGRGGRRLTNCSAKILICFYSCVKALERRLDAGWLAIEFGVYFLAKVYVHNVVNPLSAAFWGVV